MREREREGAVITWLSTKFSTVLKWPKTDFKTWYQSCVCNSASHDFLFELIGWNFNFSNVYLNVTVVHDYWHMNITVHEHLKGHW